MSMFQMSGIASGIDSKSMVEQLMALERQPILKLRTRQERFKSTNSAYQNVKSLMAGLATKVEALSKQQSAATRTITSSDNSFVRATASSDAAMGTYTVKVKQLASTTSLTSSAANGAAIVTMPADPVLTPPTKLTSLKPAGGTTIQLGTFTLGGATFSLNKTDATVDDVLAAINAANNPPPAWAGTEPVTFTGTLGTTDPVTAKIVDGRLVLEGGAGMKIGSGADTSNFLTSVAGLTTGTTQGSDLSGHRLSVTQTGKKLSEGASATNLANHAMLAASGSFMINGTTITWSGEDSINAVIKRINESGAGVSATYNTLDDKLVFTNKATGSTSISISNDTGRFLEALGVTGATAQSLGKNAEIIVSGINGGAPIARTSNTISDVIGGVTLNLAKADEAGKPVNEMTAITVTVGEDSSGLIGSVEAMVSEFNKVVGAIDNLVKKGGALQYDPTLQQLRQSLTSQLVGSLSGAIGYPKSMIDLGLNTGAAGAEVGSTNTFSLDQAKFKKALAENPSRVMEILGKMENGKPQGIMAKMGAFLEDAIGSNGTFASKDTFTTAQNKVIDKQISAMEARIEKKRETMEKRFLAMETTIAKMNAQRDRLMSQLSSMQSGMGLL
jgi:flagellar hook-associated protein 2